MGRRGVVGHTALESGATRGGASLGESAAGRTALEGRASGEHVAAEVGEGCCGAAGFDGVWGRHGLAERGGGGSLVVEDEGFLVGAREAFPDGDTSEEFRVIGKVGELSGCDAQEYGQQLGRFLVVAPLVEKLVGCDCVVHCNTKARNRNSFRGSGGSGERFRRLWLWGRA